MMIRKYHSIVILFCCLTVCSDTALKPGIHTTRINGLSLRYAIQGTGPTLLVQSPGWGLGSSIYSQTLTPLEKDFRVIYYDTRGSGGSDVPREPGSINVGAETEDLETLRRTLGLTSFSLLGHSHGGYISLNYALKYPEHISHLILISSVVGASEVDADVRRNLPTLQKDPKLRIAALRLPTLPRGATDDQLNDYFAAIIPLYFYDQTKVWRLANLRRDRLTMRAWMDINSSDRTFAVRNRLSEVRIPTLVLVGRQDFITSPEQAKILNDGITGSRLVIIEKSGHFPWLEEPDRVFSSIKDFLKLPAQ